MYSFLAMQYSTLTPAYFAAVHAKLATALTKGTKTNCGIFSHWNENNCAIFEKGFCGYESLHFIQIDNEERDKRSLERTDKMLAAFGLPKG
jgi:hypothetical protein